MSETISLDILEAAARAAVPGPWELAEYEVTPSCRAMVYSPPDEDYQGERICTCNDMYAGAAAMKHTTYRGIAEANARYIAMANPSTVLALIARIRDAEGGKP